MKQKLKKNNKIKILFRLGRDDWDLADGGERDHRVALHREDQPVSGWNVHQGALYSHQTKGKHLTASKVNIKYDTISTTKG